MINGNEFNSVYGINFIVFMKSAILDGFHFVNNSLKTIYLVLIQGDGLYFFCSKIVYANNIRNVNELEINNKLLVSVVR